MLVLFSADDHQAGLMRSSVVILIFLQLVSDVTAVCCRLCWEDFTCDMFIIDNITSWSANQWPRHMAGIKSGGGRFTAFQDTVRFQPHVTSQGAQSNEFTSWQPFFISSRTQLCLKQRCRRYKQNKRARRARQSLTGGGSTGVLQVLLFLLKQRV